MFTRLIKNYTVALVAILMVFMAQSTYAQTAPMTLSNNFSDMVIIDDLYHDGTLLNNGNGIYVGALQGTLSGVNTLFFCYDLNHDTPSLPASYVTNVVSPGSSALQTTYSSFGLQPTFNFTVAAALENSLNVGSLDANHLAALQLAIWSILYNWTSSSQPLNLGTSPSSGFYATGVPSNISNDAIAYLTQAQGYVSNPNWGNVKILINSQDKTQVLGGGVGTPEPQTYLLMGSMLLVALVLFRKQKAVKAI
jgi:hypothetical protein